MFLIVRYDKYDVTTKSEINCQQEVLEMYIQLAQFAADKQCSVNKELYQS